LRINLTILPLGLVGFTSGIRCSLLCPASNTLTKLTQSYRHGLPTLLIRQRHPQARAITPLLGPVDSVDCMSCVLLPVMSHNHSSGHGARRTDLDAYRTFRPTEAAPSTTQQSYSQSQSSIPRERLAPRSKTGCWYVPQLSCALIAIFTLMVSALLLCLPSQ